MADPAKLLADLGFGDYETRAYLALLRRSPANGYELAKASDIPRGNIYAVLQKLEERGAVLRMDSPDGTRYAPVAPDELLALLKSRFGETVEAAAQALKQAGTGCETVHVWNLDDYAALLEHARLLVESAGRELLLAVWPEEAHALAQQTRAAAERGVDIRTLCLAGCAHECGACRGKVHRYRMAREHAAHWLVCVADGSEVLAGAGRATPDGSADRAATAPQGVRTRQSLLVDLAASYIRHSIALAAVVADVPPEVAANLSPQTREVLEMVGQADGFQGWMASLGLGQEGIVTSVT